MTTHTQPSSLYVLHPSKCGICSLMCELCTTYHRLLVQVPVLQIWGSQYKESFSLRESTATQSMTVMWKFFSFPLPPPTPLFHLFAMPICHVPGCLFHTLDLRAGNKCIKCKKEVHTLCAHHLPDQPTDSNLVCFACFPQGSTITLQLSPNYCRGALNLLHSNKNKMRIQMQRLVPQQRRRRICLRRKERSHQEQSRRRNQRP